MKKIFLFLLLGACGGANWIAPDDFVYMPVKTDSYEFATWQKINNPKNKNIHIYIEGDGHSFDAYGQPTSDPTPRGTFVRDLAVADDFENVVYMARACQFIMDNNCVEADWTSGRFSKKIIDAQSSAIKQIAKDNKITLIGYSGGAMVSGLVIKQNPDLKVVKWITIAGVLNHEKWSQYHKDKPLDKSLNMEKLPNVPQKHFVGGKDENVPFALAKTWADESDIILIKSAAHDGFEKFGCDILNSL